VEKLTAAFPWNFRHGLTFSTLKSAAVARVTAIRQTGVTMLHWALTFLVVAIIAAIFGFGGIAATASSVAQILFVVFLALFLVSAIVAMTRGRPPAV
jgi:uncharacterized membrane protein YtjA (UPF0391 family)